MKAAVLKKITIYFTFICMMLFINPSYGRDLFIKNLVSTPKMASYLAEFYIKNTYGEKVSETEKPYSVTDKGDLWVVNGNLPAEFTAGGVFTITISKNNGAVQHLSHSK